MLISAIAVALVLGAQTQPKAAPPPANRMAYEAAIKCFIINGVATGERQRAGDKAKATSHEAAARRSFDLATQLGGRLGLSGTRINQDMSLAQTVELPRFTASDLTYYREVAATCKALGLLG